MFTGFFAKRYEFGEIRRKRKEQKRESNISPAKPRQKECFLGPPDY